MRIDLGSLAFGNKLKDGGGNPNWATALGQGKDYKINTGPDIDELLKGLIYSSVSLAKVTTKVGKGGKVVSGEEENSPILVAALFRKVYINDSLITDGAFVILVTRDSSATHGGRLRFKYGPSNTYSSDGDVYSNKSFWEKAKQQLGFADKACFFVYDISVKKQNELYLSTVVVDKHNAVEYANTDVQRTAWEKLIIDDEKRKGIVSSKQPDSNDSSVENEIEESNHKKTCFDISRNPRTQKIHPLNYIVYGAPGTGKTYSMVEYALAIMDNKKLDEFRKDNTDRSSNIERYKELVKEGQVVFTTFHQNYGYEEFIQGLRPDIESEDMSFKIIDGVFKTIADRALNDNENKNYIIIIDEINRANISKVFGELITLIEEDKRWGELNEMSATLQSGDVFAIPNNLYIVGTMNSADKSISLIDSALRRRFNFIEQRPQSELVESPILKSILETINLKLVEEFESPDLLVGHSYFMNKNEEDLCDILNNNIIPLLYEYFYDNRKKVENLINEAIKNVNDKVKIYDDKIGRIRVKESEL